jgi:uncharacterized membrane protein
MKLIGFLILLIIFLFILVGSIVIISMIASIPKQTAKAKSSNNTEMLLDVGSLEGSQWFVCTFESILMIFSVIMIFYLVITYIRKQKQTTYDGLDFGFGDSWLRTFYYGGIFIVLLIFTICVLIQASQFAVSSDCEEKDKAPTLFAASFFTLIFVLIFLIFRLIVPLVQKIRSRSSASSIASYTNMI